jgi:hypothetical protein
MYSKSFTGISSSFSTQTIGCVYIKYKSQDLVKKSEV